MIVVVDASAMLALFDPASQGHRGVLMAAVARSEITLVAPHLMWSEATSALHLLVNRGRIDGSTALQRLSLLDAAPVRSENPPGLHRRAWDIADLMGWGRTYDAEYCALADLIGGTLITDDGRLVRAAEGRLSFVTSLKGADELLSGG